VRKIKGKGSEDRVEVFLREKGFRILARNYRKVFGEIDIIAEKEGEVWFLEVKTVNKNFPPIDKIDKRKILRMVKVAETFEILENFAKFSQNLEDEEVIVRNLARFLSGGRLKDEEVLLSELFMCNNPYYDPEGKVITMMIPLEEIREYFDG